MTRSQSALLLALRLAHGPAWIRSAVLDLQYLPHGATAWAARGIPAPTVFAAADAVLRLSVAVAVVLGVRLERVAWLGLAVWSVDFALFDPDAWMDVRPWAPEPILEAAGWLPLVVLGVLAAWGAGPLSVDGAIERLRRRRAAR